MATISGHYQTLAVLEWHANHVDMRQQIWCAAVDL